MRADPAAEARMGVIELLVGILATWRVTHLLQAEDGPWDLSLRLRRAAGNGVLGRMLDCFYCLSLWIAAAIAPVLARELAEGVLLWLALSGGASALERMLPPEVHYTEDP
jgi:hypothetical protein